MPRAFSGHVLVRVTVLEQEGPVFVSILQEPRAPEQHMIQVFKEFSVSGNIPDGSEESLDELVLEEALAEAMAIRQGDE